MSFVKWQWVTAPVAFAVLTALVFGAESGRAASSNPNGGPSVTSVTSTQRTLTTRTALAVDSGWSLFVWSGNGAPFNMEGAFLTTSNVTAYVTIVDSFCPGDQFRVFDNNSTIGDTSIPKSGPCTRYSPDEAYRDPMFSRGTLVLSPGSHSITIQAIANPWYSGGAYIRVDSRPYSPSATPTPTTSPTPTSTPAGKTVASPTPTPTPAPTAAPTPAPTAAPTPAPTAAPTPPPKPMP